MKNLVLITCLILSSFSVLISQDTIELRSGEKIQAIITKVGLEEIEFRNFGSEPASVIIKLDKYLVKSYEFAGQSAVNLERINKLTDIGVADIYDKEAKMVFKIQPLHFLRNDFKFAVERSIDYKSSYEIELGARKFKSPIISLSNNPDEQIYFNALVRYKMYLRPTSVKMTDIGKSAMDGLYLAPYAAAGTSQNNGRINTNWSSYTVRNPTPNFYGSLGLDLGGQISTSNLVLDLFVGAGFSLNSANAEFSRNTTHFSTDKLALRSGVRIGISDKLIKYTR